MREIKFKLWLPNEKKMTYAFDITDLPDKTQTTDGMIYLQFTGLKDKNGKEIYEGDIVKCSDWVADANAFNEWDRTIEWDDKAGMWNGIDSDIIEVIGNIYENPLPPS